MTLLKQGESYSLSGKWHFAKRVETHLNCDDETVTIEVIRLLFIHPTRGWPCDHCLYNRRRTKRSPVVQTGGNSPSLGNRGGFPVGM
ncbi:hypothetical protein [Phormidium sp. CCY1219]|uniref:hypothetical protein n=1 Tax=Phormidium sp. CCY1219 TaxID=2886104 RepID=UPI002D1F50CF|nr:hypothetical protein [Phormidium sp. CCY1219]MEB3829211.1 hypothetical protein [Phormidium sp. CCY1219]